MSTQVEQKSVLAVWRPSTNEVKQVGSIRDEHYVGHRYYLGVLVLPIIDERSLTIASLLASKSYRFSKEARKFPTKNMAISKRSGPPPPTMFSRKNRYKATRINTSLSALKRKASNRNIFQESILRWD